MGYIKNLMDKVIALQTKFRPDMEEYYQEAKTRTALLRIVGLDGETLVLTVNNGRISYGDPNDKPVHVFRCSSDTFLDLLSGETTVRKEATLGHFTIEDANSGEINIVELEKWSKAFDRMRGLLKVVS